MNPTFSQKLSKADNTKAKIIDTAITLFSEKGYENVSTKEIAKKSFVSEGTIFRYFNTKSQLLHDAIFPIASQILPTEVDRVTSEVLSNNNLNFTDFLTLFYNDRYQYVWEHFNALKVFFSRLLFNPQMKRDFLKMLSDKEVPTFIDVIEEYQRNHELTNLVNAEEIITGIITQFVFLIVKEKIIEDNTTISDNKRNDEISKIVRNINTLYGGTDDD